MRLFSLLYSIAGTVLSGVGIVVVLVAGLPGWQPIAIAMALGALAAVFATWIAVRKITMR